MIQMPCSCGLKLQVQDQYAGKQAICPKCGSRVDVPVPSIQSLVAPAPAAPINDAEELLEVEPIPAAELLPDDAFTQQPQPAPYAPQQSWAPAPPPYQQEPKKGKGLLIGLIVGGSVLGILLIVLLSVVFYMAMDRANNARSRMLVSNNFKQITIAAHTYHDTRMLLPKHAIYEGEQRGNPNGKALLSWRVSLLPYLEQGYLYNRFRLDEPWDSPHNIRLLKEMPEVYAHPLDEKANKKGYTYYQAFVGSKWKGVSPPFVDDPKFTCSLMSIMDGTSNTFMFVEASRPVPWTKPEDIPYDGNRSVPKLGLFKSGFMAAFADGSVRMIPRSIDNTNLRNLITMNDGQVVAIPDD